MSIQNLTYRFSLDTFKNGVQRILQGHQTGEHTARRMEISLVSGAEAYELPMSGIVANMYVKRPSQTSPSINPCTIDHANNKIIYQIQDTDIQESGIVECQLKLIDIINEKTLVSPKFGMEVWESQTSDSDAEDTPTYATLTEALAAVVELQDKAIKEVYIDEDNIFTVLFYDDTTYTSSVIADAIAQIADVSAYTERAEAAAESAEASAQSASTSEQTASGYVDTVVTASQSASQSATSANASASAALSSEQNASASATSASNSAQSASASASASSLSASNASASEASASASATSASGSASSASTSASSASASASSASTSATNATSYANLSQSYAVGGTSTRQGEDTDNAKYYKERCEQIAGGLEGGILPMGTVPFSDLPTITSEKKGWMFNISTDFTSDARFKDGGGKVYAMGTNVYITSDLMFDCFSGSTQTVNGQSGPTITLDGGDIAVTGYTKPSATSPIAVTDTVNQALGKLEKHFDEVSSGVNLPSYQAYLDGLENGTIKTNDDKDYYFPISDEVPVPGGGGGGYVLPMASASALGGIKASPKTADDDVEVKIDASTGKLYVSEADKADKVYVVSNTESIYDTPLEPNKFYNLGELADFYLECANPSDNTILNEYMFEFQSGATATEFAYDITNITLWNDSFTISANKTYQGSIVNGICIIVEV